MLAPNPNTPRPTRRQPWEIPADLPVQTLQTYGHRVACEVAAYRIRQAMRAAANAFARPTSAVFCDDVPFASTVDAARFMLASGAFLQKEHALIQGIRRACLNGKPYAGRRWRYSTTDVT
jgi:hypothetical protein